MKLEKRITSPSPLGGMSTSPARGLGTDKNVCPTKCKNVCPTKEGRIARLSAGTLLLLMTTFAHAGPTQTDVFKSIQDSVGERHEINSMPVILLALGGGLVLGVLVYMSRREQKKVVAPAALNHAGKLAKEVLKEMNLKPNDLKQLKILADSIASQVGETPDPLALLLCPSLLAKGVSANPSKMDRKVVAQMVRRMRE